MTSGSPTLLERHGKPMCASHQPCLFSSQKSCLQWMSSYSHWQERLLHPAMYHVEQPSNKWLEKILFVNWTWLNNHRGSVCTLRWKPLKTWTPLNPLNFIIFPDFKCHKLGKWFPMFRLTWIFWDFQAWITRSWSCYQEYGNLWKLMETYETRSMVERSPWQVGRTVSCSFEFRTPQYQIMINDEYPQETLV